MTDRKILREIEHSDIVIKAQGNDLQSVKIPRIKALKKIQPMGLKEAKEWVEAHYLDNGYGDPCSPPKAPLLHIEVRGRVIVSIE